ncbi:MAG: hypothetical protein ABID67_01945 [Candidatus Nealsonbacteria bacterium]
MNNKTIIYIVSVIVLVLVVGWYFLWSDSSLVQEEEQIQEQVNQAEDIKLEEVKLVDLVNDDFEIKHPEGWRKLTPPEGIQVLLTNIGEEQIDPEKEKDGFNTYLAITKDVLQGKNTEEFVAYVKNILTDSLPSIVFNKEEAANINGRDAIAIEALVTQEGYKFSTLLFMIRGEGDDMWTLSFNTSEIKWEDSKDLFYEISNSFKLK